MSTKPSVGAYAGDRRMTTLGKLSARTYLAVHRADGGDHQRLLAVPNVLPRRDNASRSLASESAVLPNEK